MPGSARLRGSLRLKAGYNSPVGLIKIPSRGGNFLAGFLADPHCNGEDFPGPCRESVTSKIPPIMRLNIGGPEFGHRVLSSEGAYEHGRKPAHRAVSTVDYRTPNRETVGTAAP